MPQYQGVWSLQQQMQALTSGQWATDPLFDYTTLLLQGDNPVTNTQNNTFLDSSTNNFAITRTGNPTQGSFTPFSLQPGAWANYFDGSGDFLTAADNTAFQFGTGTLTVEFWYFPMASLTNAGLVDMRASSSSNAGLLIRQGDGSSSGTQITCWAGNPSTTAATQTGLNINQWNHVAVVRDSSNNLQVFVNGSGGTAVARSINLSDQSLRIAAFVDASASPNAANGYISNLRITKGGALYTSTFTPSTTPLTTTVSAGTVSLLTCQSNRFVDNSSNAFAVTVNGTPSVQAFSPFAPQFQYTTSGTGGSGYFDGGTNRLTTTTSSQFNLNGTNFTFECWVYVTAAPSVSNRVITIGPNDAQSSTQLAIETNLSVSFSVPFSSGGSVGTSANALRLNSWTHIAFTLSGVTGTIYLNGTQAGQSTNWNITSTSNNYFYIGYDSTPTVDGKFTGYITDTRLVVGSVVYTGNFTPPTAPLTAISNTRFLCSFSNASIIDGTMKNALETVGNAQLSGSVVKYGSGSMYFDGTNDYLLAADTSTGNFGSGDFTIEFWAYDIARSASGTVWVSKWGNSASLGRCWVIGYVTSSTSLVFNISTDGSTQTSLLSATITPSLGTWNHYAVTRAGNTYRMFLNGTLLTSAVNTGTLYAPTKPLCVGANYEDVQSSLNNFSVNGYIDDLRLTRGIARYTQNFIPPSVALPRQ